MSCANDLRVRAQTDRLGIIIPPQDLATFQLDINAKVLDEGAMRAEYRRGENDHASDTTPMWPVRA